MLFAECVRQTHTHTLTHTYINLYIEVVFQHMQKPIKPSMAWRGCCPLSAPLRTFCSPLRSPPDDIVSLAYCVADAYLRISIKFVKKIEMCDSRRFTRGIGSGDFAVEGGWQARGVVGFQTRVVARELLGDCGHNGAKLRERALF